MKDKDLRLFQFPQVCLVEASAGSGKTYTLAKRYVQLLINPYLKPEEIPLNTILAITFTNKAATEMKERILEFLKKIALDKFESRQEKEDILSSLAVGKEHAHKKAYRIMDEVVKNYNFFQVQTIDSFINAILSGCAFKLNLSASFKTKEDYSEYLAYSLDILVDKAGYDKDILRLFQSFLRQYLYIENRTSWFPRQDILSIIISLFSKSNKYAGKFIRHRAGTEELFYQRTKISKLIKALRNQLPPGAHGAFLKVLAAFPAQEKDGFALDRLSDFFKREDFPVTKGQVVPAETKKLWGEIRESLRVLSELESGSLFNNYIEIFNQVLGGVKNLSIQDDVLFLEALNKEARRLFDEKFLTLPELYCRLATRFKHFLIDEFQDTSRLQWENLLMMIEEALSTGGSLFYVGDKKQAIYRFRGGEVSLIDLAKERFKNYNLIEASLAQNYRSRKEIVEFNNMVFSENNLRRFLIEFSPSDQDEIIKVFEGSRQKYRDDKPGGYVKLEFLDCRKPKVLSLIEGLSKRFLLKDIAVLARKNKEVELLTSWLLEKDIPVESEKTLNIRENSYIKELVSFLKFLNSPIDNLSFASFIIGDIFSKASGLDSQEMHGFIFGLNPRTQLLRKAATTHLGVRVYLYREFRLRFPEIWETLMEDFFKSVGLVPLYELVISILGKFKVLNKFPEYQGFFMRFLELIKEQDEENPSLSSFLEFFDKAAPEDLYVNITESDSVKILTIHKSKGLEFPVVIIPFLEMNVKVDSRVAAADGEDLKLVYLKKRYRDFSPYLAGQYKGEYIKSFIDELNSIYVALTRAKDELYIFTSASFLLLPKEFPSMSLREPSPSPRWGEGGAAKQAFKEGAGRGTSSAINPPLEIPPPEYKDWIALLKDEFIDEGILSAREKVLKGEVWHTLLSFIGNLYSQDKKAVVKQALEKTRGQYPFIPDFKEFEAKLNNLLGHKELRPFFEVKEGEVYQEKEVVDSHGQTKRIDRLIVKSKEALVIDYKSSKEDSPRDYDQMREYIKIVQDIYPQAKVKGILIYLDTLKAEEVYGKNHNL